MYDNGRVVEGLGLGLGIEVKMRRLAGCLLYLNPTHPIFFFLEFLFEWSRNDGEHSLLGMGKGMVGRGGGRNASQ